MAFLTAHAIPSALAAAILAVVFAREIRRANRRLPFFRHGPTHDHPSRDSVRGGGDLNHDPRGNL